MKTTCTFTHQQWPIAGEFRIARGVKTHADVIFVHLSRGAYDGYGECVPYGRYGESVQSVLAQMQQVRPDLQHGCDHQQLQDLLPAGAARNALDCALWDLQCQQSEQSIWQILGQTNPHLVTTAYTLSLASADQMAQAAKCVPNHPILKLKLAGDVDDINRVTAIARARPAAQLILDGNEGFDLASLQYLLDGISDFNIAAIEQPLPAKNDMDLAKVQSKFPICADESLHTVQDLPQILGRYDMVNIKLDKTGGLTHALTLMQQAKAHNLQIMVGCMVATSLCMLPALVLAMQADLIDLDGPLLLRGERDGGLRYDGANIPVQSSMLWGDHRPL